ncbi:MAG: hypothetical protein KAS16_07020, partial [Thermoplasmata archaeon]|nr:hypothetical protein [Thermoplasmata archaeon]
MAGIFGYIDKKNDDESKQQFLSIIKDAGLHIKKEIVGDDFILGEAGIDIDKSNNDDLNDTISIVSQGETFDDVHQDLSTRILDLYINNKLDELNMINGSFSAAIYDNHDKKLTIVNDINGLTKVFYAIGKDDFYFAPKITPLLRMGKGGALRKDAIADFFLFGYILGDNTFLDNMFQLPAGSILELTEDGISISQYSTLQYQEEELSNDKDPLIDELGNHWHKAVERRVAKEQKIIIPISGGLDSRAILDATLKCIPKENVVTFTFGEEGSLDFDIGKRVAKKAG